MDLKPHIFALIIAGLTVQPATAQDRPDVSVNSVSQNTLTACQSLHNMPRTLSRLREHRLTASQDIFEADVEQLRKQVRSLEVFQDLSAGVDLSFEAEKQVLSRTLATLNLRLSESVLTRPPYAKSIPENFDQTLMSASRYWNCDQFASDMESPIQGEAKGGPSFDKTRSATLNPNINVQTHPGYKHVDGRDLSENASARYVAENPIKLLFEGNRHYLILLAGLSFIGGTYYMFRRIKKFEAREARRILNQLIKVRLEDEVQDFYLVDLSRNGAKLNHPRAIQNQTRLHIQLGEDWHLGQIKWHNDFFAGIMFKTPLDIETYSEITKAA